MTDDGLDIASFINAAFNPDEVDEEFPNARYICTGGLFISHDGNDFMRILEDIVEPVVSDRFADGYFLHNRRFGGASAYRFLVRAALHWCDKFMIVVSENAVKNIWVRAEVDWAFRNSRKIIRCRLDNADPRRIDARLYNPLDGFTVDLRSDPELGHKELAQILDQMLTQNPYPRFPKGRPGWRDG